METTKLKATLQCGEIIKDASEIVEWLVSHNKNYTKEQYYKLIDLQDILKGE